MCDNQTLIDYKCKICNYNGKFNFILGLLVECPDCDAHFEISEGGIYEIN